MPPYFSKDFFPLLQFRILLFVFQIYEQYLVNFLNYQCHPSHYGFVAFPYTPLPPPPYSLVMNVGPVIGKLLKHA